MSTALTALLFVPLLGPLLGLGLPTGGLEFGPPREETVPWVAGPANERKGFCGMQIRCDKSRELVALWLAAVFLSRRAFQDAHQARIITGDGSTSSTWTSVRGEEGDFSGSLSGVNRQEG